MKPDSVYMYVQRKEKTEHKSVIIEKNNKKTNTIEFLNLTGNYYRDIF